MSRPMTVLCAGAIVLIATTAVVLHGRGVGVRGTPAANNAAGSASQRSARSITDPSAQIPGVTCVWSYAAYPTAAPTAAPTPNGKKGSSSSSSSSSPKGKKGSTTSTAVGKKGSASPLPLCVVTSGPTSSPSASPTTSPTRAPTSQPTASPSTQAPTNPPSSPAVFTVGILSTTATPGGLATDTPLVPFQHTAAPIDQTPPDPMATPVAPAQNTAAPNSTLSTAAVTVTTTTTPRAKVVEGNTNGGQDINAAHSVDDGSSAGDTKASVLYALAGLVLFVGAFFVHRLRKRPSSQTKSGATLTMINTVDMKSPTPTLMELQSPPMSPMSPIGDGYLHVANDHEYAEPLNTAYDNSQNIYGSPLSYGYKSPSQATMYAEPDEFETPPKWLPTDATYNAAHPGGPAPPFYDKSSAATLVALPHYDQADRTPSQLALYEYAEVPGPKKGLKIDSLQTPPTPMGNTASVTSPMSNPCYDSGTPHISDDTQNPYYSDCLSPTTGAGASHRYYEPSDALSDPNYIRDSRRGSAQEAKLYEQHIGQDGTLIENPSVYGTPPRGETTRSIGLQQLVTNRYDAVLDHSINRDSSLCSTAHPFAALEDDTSTSPTRSPRPPSDSTYDTVLFGGVRGGDTSGYDANTIPGEGFYQAESGMIDDEDGC